MEPPARIHFPFGPLRNPCYKTMLCDKFDVSPLGCPYGSSCQYAHGPDELAYWHKKRTERERERRKRRSRERNLARLMTITAMQWPPLQLPLRLLGESSGSSSSSGSEEGDGEAEPAAEPEAGVDRRWQAQRNGETGSLSPSPPLPGPAVGRTYDLMEWIEYHPTPFLSITG